MLGCVQYELLPEHNVCRNEGGSCFDRQPDQGHPGSRFVDAFLRSGPQRRDDLIVIDLWKRMIKLAY